MQMYYYEENCEYGKRPINTNPCYIECKFCHEKSDYWKTAVMLNSEPFRFKCLNKKCNQEYEMMMNPGGFATELE